jgi:hypothetical protein
MSVGAEACHQTYSSKDDRSITREDPQKAGLSRLHDLFMTEGSPSRKLKISARQQESVAVTVERTINLTLIDSYLMNDFLHKTYVQRH